MHSTEPDESDQPSASPWDYRIFRNVWITSVASHFGGQIQAVGAAWLMVLLSSSQQMVALVQASIALPILLLALPSGAIADNLDRRLVMLLAQTFMLLVSVGLAIFAWMQWLTPVTLLTFTFLIGCGTALHAPAWQASIGDMVERPALPTAVAYNSMGFNIARSLGPAVGGAIVAAAGAAMAFFVNALSYVGLIFVLARWRPQLPDRLLPPERIDLAMAAGVRYVAMSPVIRLVLFRALLFGLSASAIAALMPLIARDKVSGDALTYGMLLGSFGVGAVIGALSMRRLRVILANEHLVQIATILFVIGTLISAFSQTLLLTMPALLLAGCGWVLVLATFNVTVQLSAPRWVVARALAQYQMAAFGGMAAGAWLAGAIAEYSGLTTALLVAAGLQLFTILIGLWQPLPRVLETNLAPLAAWNAPQPALPITSRSGPVAIAIRYCIRESDIPRFLSVMNERKRIRRRDGAHQWRLLRDLAEPQYWVERFTLATWLDYLRHNERRTHADAENIRQLRALHQGPEDILVQRMIERETNHLPGSLGADDARTDLPAGLTDTLGG